MKAKNYNDVESLVGTWTGEQEFEAIVQAIESLNGRTPMVEDDPPAEASSPSVTVTSEPVENDSAIEQSQISTQDLSELKTPVKSRSPDLSLLRAPLGPSSELRMHIPALISGKDLPTPTPSQGESPEAS